MSKKTTIIIATLVLTLLVVISSYFSVARVKQRIESNLIDEYVDQEKVIGKQVAAVLESRVNSVEDILQTVALLPEVKTGKTDECNKKLDQVFNSFKGKISNIGRVGSDKKFICSVNRATIGTDAGKYGSYINEIFNDPEHKPVLSRNVKVPNIPSNLVAIHIPVFDDNKKFIGTLGAAIYFDELQEKYLKDIVFANQGYVTLTDDDDTILYHPNKDFVNKSFLSESVQKAFNNNTAFNEKIKSAQKGNVESIRYKLGDQEKVASFVPVKIFDNRIWVIGVTVPVDEIKNSLGALEIDTNFQRIFSAFCFLMILFTSILLFYLVKTVLNPISKVAKSIKSISNGNFKERIPVKKKSKKDEITVLTNSFNDMAEKLQTSYTILEEKVEERTKELAEAKSNLEAIVKERTKELESSKQNLEKQVQTRTADLKEELDEVERFNEITIGREVKMIELKEKIYEAK